MEVLNSGTILPRSERAATLIKYKAVPYSQQFISVFLHEISHDPDWNDLVQGTINSTPDELAAG